MREYDEVTLKKVQQTELNILKDFMEICDRHGLDYFGIAGTGIGALRHGGFIPWDDDIDVAIPRDDYNRFLEYAKTELDDKYIIMNCEYDSNYPLMTTRIMLKNTEFREEALKDIKCHLGIFLDVYPFDKISDNPREFKKQARDAWFWSKMLILRSIPFPVLGFKGIKAKLVHAACGTVHLMMKLCRISKKWLYGKCYEASTRYNHYDKTERLDFLCDTTPYMNIYKVSDIYPLNKRPFEDIMLNFPRNMHENLTGMYGDYMKLPPEDKRKNHFPYSLKFEDELSRDSKYRYMDSLFLDEYKAMDKLNVYSEDELKAAYVKDGIVLPCKTIDGKKRAGVLDENGEYVKLSAFNALSPVDCWGGGYGLKKKPRIINEKVMYMGRFWKHWGHFTMDMVSRLWYAMEVDKSIKLVYDATEDISGVYAEFMRLAGLDESRFIRIDEPTGFSNVVVPECSYKPGISCNVRFKQIFDTVAENAMREYGQGDKYKGKKLYFTRTGLNLRVPLEAGESDIEKLFKDNGYMIISPEKYELKEQIAMLRQAKEIVCVSGTIPHNMMFASDGARITIIRKTNKPNYRQTDVNMIRRLKTVNVDAHISPFAVGAGGPFILDVNDNVRKYFHDRGMKLKYSGFLGWWKRKLRMLWYIPLYFLRNKGARPQVPLYDGERFTTRADAKRELRKFYLKRL